MTTHPADAFGPPTLESSRWRFDPSHSSVEFHAKAMWNLVTVKGAFSRYQGTLDLGARPAVELTVDGDSIDTRNEKRDVHLRSPDFLDVERHPYLRFASESTVVDGDRLQVRGTLHARGGSAPVTVDATLRRVDGELTFEAAGTVDRRELGMTWNMLGTMGPRVKVMMKGRLVPDGG